MLRHNESQSDIVFQAIENLTNLATGELVLTKNSFKTIAIAGERTLESYIHEFCGLMGLNYHSLRFQVEHRDINQSIVVTSSCLLKVSHMSGVGFSGLAQSLKRLFSEHMGADVKIRFGHQEIPYHAFLLASRSPRFARLLNEERKEDIIVLPEYNDDSKEAITSVLLWIYTGQADFPENIFSVIRLLAVAREFEIQELAVRCEEDIRAKLSAENVLELLIRYGNSKANVLSEDIWNECKSLFLTLRWLLFRVF